MKRLQHLDNGHKELSVNGKHTIESKLIMSLRPNRWFQCLPVFIIISFKEIMWVCTQQRSLSYPTKRVDLFMCGLLTINSMDTTSCCFITVLFSLSCFQTSSPHLGKRLSSLLFQASSFYLMFFAVFCPPVTRLPSFTELEGVNSLHWQHYGPRLNGNYWVYVRVKVLNEDINLSWGTGAHGSCLFDLTLTSQAPLKERGLIDHAPSSLKNPQLLTRSNDPSLNFRTQCFGISWNASVHNHWSTSAVHSNVIKTPLRGWQTKVKARVRQARGSFSSDEKLFVIAFWWTITFGP